MRQRWWVDVAGLVAIIIGIWSESPFQKVLATILLVLAAALRLDSASHQTEAS